MNVIWTYIYHHVIVMWPTESNAVLYCHSHIFWIAWIWTYYLFNTFCVFWCSFAHPHFVPNLYDFLASAKRKILLIIIIIIFCLYNENQSDSVLFQTPLTFICLHKNCLWSAEERKSYRFGIKYCFTKHLRTFWPEASVYISVLDSLNTNADGWKLFCNLKIFAMYLPPLCEVFDTNQIILQQTA